MFGLIKKQHMQVGIEQARQATELVKMHTDDSGIVVVGEDDLEKLLRGMYLFGATAGHAQSAGNDTLLEVAEKSARAVLDKIKYHYGQGKRR